MSAVSVAFWILFSLGILLLVLSAFLYYVGHRTRLDQNKMLYHPEVPSESRDVCESPVQLGIPNAEDISVFTADGFTLRGFMLWPDRPPLPEKVLEDGSASCAYSSKEPTTTAVTFGDHADVKGIASSNVVTRTLSRQGLSNVERGSGGSHGVSASEPVKDGRMPSFVLLYFHGNAGNVGHRLGLAQAFVERLGCAVFMVDYRGYGFSSEAVPNQQGLETDAEACLDYLWNDPRVPKDRIYVMGTSLGGAVAIHLASSVQYSRRIKAVIIENTFTSISDMTSSIGETLLEQYGGRFHRVLFWLFNHYVKPLVLQLRWRNVQAITAVHKPTLFLSGLRDELIPPSHMKQLFTKAQMMSDALVDPKPMRRLVEFPEGMHNNLPLMSGYFESIQAFVDTVSRS
ncbi:Bem46-like serine peptidase [Strigomonas culicis]|uniref:Bem46-like serine peptidase n=1 Tax=Strigomonas culicis TaxID=28005 RepID=S9UB68_9TRYP|nr:Bem46-like serine peptidase [Strigomonas culicis]EPY37014.1 Bem46-like serine peptidase [Strigomonas culicis]|eukprot:EPY25984.1 Bem46-like serine peptidase [Strigomonas culicis]